MPGTENAAGMFFSPDGRWLGFDRDGELKRVSLTGGPPLSIAPASGNATATWLPDDSIVFATTTDRVLQRVPLSGGQPVTLTTLDSARGDTLHLLPQAIDEGRAILFTIASGSLRHVAVLRLDSGRTDLIVEGTHGTYVPGGYLVFWRNGTLWAAPFNLERLTLSGRAAPLSEGVERTDDSVLHFATSPAGSMVYVPAAKGAATAGHLKTDADLSGDGQRLLFLGSRSTEPAAAPQLVWVQHWLDDVRARVALVQ